jgi:hypothetical protein
MRRRLALYGANDLASHFDRIKRSVTHGGRVTTLRRTGSRNARYQFDEVDEHGTLWLSEMLSESARRSRKSPPRFPMRISVTPYTATEWLFDGEAPLRVETGDALPWGLLYRGLPVGDTSIVDSNLTTTDSAICLASRLSGDSATKSVCDSLSFAAKGMEATLAQLLAVQGWGGKAISRISLFNSRTERPDRPTGNATIVVADGDGAFLTTVSRADFARSDVVGVISRTVDRDRLEALGSKIEELRQWFEVELTDSDAELPPFGIGVVSLSERHV